MTFSIIKATYHVGDGIRLANIRKELVAQALAFGGARDQTGDVDELDDGRV